MELTITRLSPVASLSDASLHVPAWKCTVSPSGRTCTSVSWAHCTVGTTERTPTGITKVLPHLPSMR